MWNHRVFEPAGLLALLAATVSAQPLINPKGIVNSASFAPPQSVGGAIAQGSIFSIFGSNMGPTVGVQPSAFPLETVLGGVGVKVIQGATSADAIPVYASAGVINAIMPSNAPLGAVSVQVTYGGAKSNLAPVRIAANAPGIFTATGAGVGPGSIQNFISATQQPINSARLTATPGQAIILWLTGMGPIKGPDNAAPPVGNLPFPVEVWVGGRLMTNLQYFGRTPCCAGVDQIVFNLPQNIPTGCFVPVTVRMAGAAMSNTTTIAIDSQGAACSDPANPLSTAFTRGGRNGFIALIRRLIRNDVNTRGDVITDQAIGTFRRETGADYSFNPSAAVPPAGSCSIYNGRGDYTDTAAPFISDAATLDAGSLSVTGPSGIQPLILFNAADYSAYGNLFGSTGVLPPGQTQKPLFLNPGTFQIAGSGGSAVGPFSVQVAVPGGLTWTNRDQLTTLDRSQGFTVSWTGTAPGVAVGLMNYDRPSNTSSGFLCLAPPGVTTLNVPAWVMTNITPTRAIPTQSRGMLSLMSATTPVSFTASGLDTGAAFFLQMAVRIVTIK